MKQMDGDFHYGVGRRKTSSAQVRLYPAGQGVFVVNGKPMEEYFTRNRDRMAVTGPLAVAGLGGFTVTAVVHGGGVTGQAGAVMQGLARALVKGNPDLRGPLRREGFLTRDPREKERKKPGLKRARKAPQYTKR
jgi:small subunit ribosomal protein S9